MVRALFRCRDHRQVLRDRDRAQGAGAFVIDVRPVALDGGLAIGVMVELPNARDLSISTAKGFVACGLFDVMILDALHPERRVVAARVTGVASRRSARRQSPGAAPPPRRRSGCGPG